MLPKKLTSGTWLYSITSDRRLFNQLFSYTRTVMFYVSHSQEQTAFLRIVLIYLW